MQRTSLVRLTIVLTLLFFHAGSVRPGEVAEGATLTRLAEGVFAHITSHESSAVSNSGIVVLEKSVLVFDTHFTPEAAGALLSEIQKITSKPVRYLVNSHYHPDHTHGNSIFPNAPRIFGSTNARRDMLQKDLPSMNRVLTTAQGQIDKMKKELLSVTDPAQQSSMKAQISERQRLVEKITRQKVLAPAITVDDSLDLEDEARPLRLLYLGRGHTDGDLVLVLPGEKIAFVGDLFLNEALPNTQDAFLLEWIQTLKEMLKLDAETFVPGHGRVGTRDQLKGFMRYLEELREWVEPGVTRGDSIEKVLREVQLPSKYSSYDFQVFFPHNVQRMFIELRVLQAHAASPPDPSRKPPPNP